MPENRIVLFLDSVQDLQTSAAEQIEINGEFAIDFCDQRHSPMEPFAGSINFKLHHRAESGSVLSLSNLLFAHAKTAQIFERQVNAPFLVIDAYVLPEIGELQGRACEIGELLALG